MHKIQIPSRWLYWYRYNDSDTYVCLGLQPMYIDTFKNAGFGIFNYQLDLPIRHAGEPVDHEDHSRNVAYCVFDDAADAILFKFNLGDKIAIELKKGPYDD